MRTIYLAGGCFWGLQKFFDQFDGVLATQVGYANGPDKAPSYRDVCQNCGHAETVKIDYDEGKLSFPPNCLCWCCVFGRSQPHYYIGQT